MHLLSLLGVVAVATQNNFGERLDRLEATVQNLVGLVQDIVKPSTNFQTGGLDTPRRTLEEAKKPKPLNFEKYKGVFVKTDDAVVALGHKSDIALARTGDGKLVIQAKSIDLASDVTVKGKPIRQDLADSLEAKLKGLKTEVGNAKDLASQGTIVHYGDKQFYHCKGSSRRCTETSSIQHGSSREIIISGNQNLGTFELEFFVTGNSFVEVFATVMHCGGGCHSDFMDRKFAFNGYTTIREMRNDGYKDIGDIQNENTWTNTGGAAKTGGHWSITRRVVSYNQHGAYSSIMRLKHTKGSYSYGGPYFIRVRSSNHHLGLIRHIDEGPSTCLFDCKKAGCTGKQATGKKCSCYISGSCPELTWSNPSTKHSECC